jgi:hypothetical protein
VPVPGQTVDRTLRQTRPPHTTLAQTEQIKSKQPLNFSSPPQGDNAVPKSITFSSACQSAYTHEDISNCAPAQSLTRILDALRASGQFSDGEVAGVANDLRVTQSTGGPARRVNRRTANHAARAPYYNTPPRNSSQPRNYNAGGQRNFGGNGRNPHQRSNNFMGCTHCGKDSKYSLTCPHQNVDVTSPNTGLLNKMSEPRFTETTVNLSANQLAPKHGTTFSATKLLERSRKYTSAIKLASANNAKNLANQPKSAGKLSLKNKPENSIVNGQTRTETKSSAIQLSAATRLASINKTGSPTTQLPPAIQLSSKQEMKPSSTCLPLRTASPHRSHGERMLPAERTPQQQRPKQLASLLESDRPAQQRSSDPTSSIKRQKTSHSVPPRIARASSHIGAGQSLALYGRRTIGQGAPPLASWTLKEKFGKFKGGSHDGKKTYTKPKTKCEYCHLAGHSIRFCPATPTVPPEEQKIKFVEDLLVQFPFPPPEEVAGLSKGEALDRLKSRGEILNRGNPWADSDLKQDQLRAKLGYWCALGASKSVVSFLAYGINLQFESKPERLAFRNHPGAKQHADFLRTQIAKDVKSGALEIIPPEFAAVLNPLHVQVKHNGKLRKLDDCRHPNAKLAFCKFRQETLKSTVPEIVLPGDLLFSIDLAAAYHNLPISEASRPYFCSEFEGVVYCPRSLLFGNSLGPYAFSRVTKPIITFLRALGIRCMGYVDDFLFADSPKTANTLVPFVLDLFATLGWEINAKSHLTPSLMIEFLGMGLDTTSFEYRLTPEKVERAQSLVDALLPSAQNGSAVLLADVRELTGFLISQTIACPPLSVWTRDLLRDASHCASMSKTSLILSEDSVDELNMIKPLLRNHNGAPIIHPGFSERWRLDAGESGAGGHKDSSTLEFSCPLPTDLIGSSSTLRELFAFEKLLTEKGSILAKHPCIVFDSANAVKILTKGGSGKKDIADATKNIFHLLHKLSVSPVYAWVPRERNKHADRLSKRWDHAWTLTGITTNRIHSVWPGVEIVCNRFNTIGWFLRNRKITRKGPVVIVFPKWHGQAWWPTLLSQSKGSIDLGFAFDCFLPTWQQDPIGTGRPPWMMHAALLT